MWGRLAGLARGAGLGSLLLLAACDQPTPPRPAPPLPTPARLLAGAPQHRYDLPGLPPEVKDLAATALGRQLQIEHHGSTTVVRLPLQPGEALWGFGQRMDAFNLRGRAFDVWAEDSWNRTDTSYFAVPWLVSSRGYGLFINSTARLKVDLGSADPNQIRIEIPEPGVELWAITGAPREVVAAYSALVGRPQSAPAWVFQPWLSRNSFLSAYEVDRNLTRMETNGLKVGAVVLEAWEQHLHNFQFETNRYPDPAGWMARLKRRGVQVICWTTASIWTGDPSYTTARDRGFLVRNEDGSEHVTRWLENGRKMDFRSAAARDWWRDQHRTLIDQGVAGFKTDGGEHMPDPWFHNQHPYFYQRTTLDAYAAAGRPGITFARAANPLCTGLGTFWGGDQHAEWSNLAVVVRGGLAAAWSGFFYWSHDVGGYTGTPDRELYLRWLQLGAFSPMMQLHGITAREPWHYDSTTLDLARGYFKVRERLQPYLLELAREAREQGLPMWRPLAWAFPRDPVTWTIGDQFMLGDQLLLAPVLTTNHARSVYLPAGDWVDLWEGTTWSGPTQFVRQADLAVLPAYAPAAQAKHWRNLFRSVPRPPPSPLALELAGARNERGVVDPQRYLRKGKVEAVSFTILNHAPVLAEGHLTLQLPAGFQSAPDRQAFRLAPGQSREMTFHLTPPPDLPPGSYPVQGLCRVGTLTAKTPKVVLVQSPAWKILGPLAGGVGQPHALDGMAKPDLAEPQPGRKGDPLYWQTVLEEAQAADGRIDLGPLTTREGPFTCFLYTTLSAAYPHLVRAHAGSGDAMSIWLNGKEMLSRPVYRNPERDEDVVELLLAPGQNHLLIRISHAMGAPDFYFRLNEPPR